jgi:DNA invertase Pin-like site-specific DNA recombinase
MAKAISYMRFSASHQEKGSTLERQQEKIDQWLANNPDVEKSHLSRVDKGASGYTGQHLERGFGDIQQAIKDKEIKAGDYLLVEAIDRLGRLEPMDMIAMINPICKAGVVIVTLEDNHHYSKESLASNGFELIMLAGKVQQAYEYSNRLSTRVLGGNKKKRANAKEGKEIKKVNPIWLTNKGRLIPENAKMVKACIDLYLAGLGSRAIIIKLQTKYTHLNTVHPTTLKRWFSNPAIIGDWNAKGGTIEGIFEPLIDKDTFFTLQRAIKHRALHPSPPRHYDLSGLLVCEKCGKAFHYRRKVHNDTTIIYSNCGTYLKRGAIYCDNNKTWPYEILLYIYRETYPDFLVFLAADHQATSNIDKIANKKEELESTSLELKKLVGLASTIGDTVDELAEEIKVVNNKKNVIKLELVSLEQEEVSTKYDQAEVLKQYHLFNINPILRRESLVKLGYKLMVLDDQITVNSSDGLNAKLYKLIKRSTKHKCYFVEYHTSNKIIKLAISKDGLIAKTSQENISWEDFSRDIEDFGASETLEVGDDPFTIGSAYDQGSF